MEFTYKAYGQLIHLLKNKGYSISTYHNHASFERVVILRHDVDSSIDKALLMAELEQSLGVTGTYFFLLSTDFYNIASRECTRKIKQIQNMGHEIGLHFDEIKYRRSSDSYDILPHLYNEVKIMELILDTPIRTVSMHRPSSTALEADYDLGDIVNSYSKVFFEDFKYVSDSRRYWREDVIKVVNTEAFNRLHILTHPFWYNEREISINENIAQFINMANLERYNQLQDNIRNLNEIMAAAEVR